MNKKEEEIIKNWISSNYPGRHGKVKRYHFVEKDESTDIAKISYWIKFQEGDYLVVEAQWKSGFVLVGEIKPV